MTFTERRRFLRAILAGGACVSPADVYDPLSARTAEAVGYRAGVLTGAMASAAVLAAPDLVLLTLTEFAELARRITRASNLALLVDADHGYGNALNAMRTVRELEHAGVAGLTLEDTALPRRFRQPEGSLETVSIEEMTGKLRAALEAREDPTLVIAGRLSLRIRNPELSIARARAYAAAGVDALFVVGLETLDQLEAVRAAVDVPLMLGPVPASLARDDLAARGARIVLHGHEPAAAAVKAMRRTYTHLFDGGSPAELGPTLASSDEMEQLTRTPQYRAWQAGFLR